MRKTLILILALFLTACSRAYALEYKSTGFGGDKFEVYIENEYDVNQFKKCDEICQSELKEFHIMIKDAISKSDKDYNINQLHNVDKTINNFQIEKIKYNFYINENNGVLSKKVLKILSEYDKSVYVFYLKI